MTAFYPLLTLFSIVVFAWLARRLAATRNRNVIAWCLAGAVFPPALFVLYALKPVDPEIPEEGEGD